MMFSTSSLLTAALLVSSVVSSPILVHRSDVTSKAGLAVVQTEPLAPLFQNPKIQWGYNWAATRANSAFGDNIKEFVPMCWGGIHINECKSGIDKSIKEGEVKHILGFNEPDETGQANMSPTLAAQQFQEVLTPYASGKIKLGAPAVTSRDAAKNPGKGLDWLFDFLDHCKTCQISFIPLHWYGYQPEGENVEAFKAYMTEARKKLVEKGWDKPIWVTELGVMDKSETENVNFLKDATSWMEEQSYIERYSYFAAEKGELKESRMITADGRQLNSLGQAYNTI